MKAYKALVREGRQAGGDPEAANGALGIAPWNVAIICHTDPPTIYSSPFPHFLLLNANALIIPPFHDSYHSGRFYAKIIAAGLRK